MKQSAAAACALAALLGCGGSTPAARADASSGFKIATWNLEWLTQRSDDLPSDAAPKRDDDIAALAGYAATLDADVVALEEVDNLALVGRIFPPGRYQLFITADGVVQKVALAVRRGIDVDRHPDLTALDVIPTEPHRLRSGLDVSLRLGHATLRLLAVHLKSGCFDGALQSSPRDACRKLTLQLPVLQGWIRARAAEASGFAILGDFNRHLLQGDPLLAGLEQAAPMRLATEGHASPCWGGEDFIDQILLGGAAASRLVPDSLRVMVYRETDPDMKERLSDHCPVSIRLRPDG